MMPLMENYKLIALDISGTICHPLAPYGLIVERSKKGTKNNICKQLANLNQYWAVEQILFDGIDHFFERFTSLTNAKLVLFGKGSISE